MDISAALRHDIVNPGPIRMLLQFVPAFDYVLLLTAANQNVQETLKTWLAPCISPDKLDIKRTVVTDLSDHTMISQVTRQAMENIVEQFHLPENGEGVTYHLSPGSPVTHAVLLLLATIRYNGVTLMQTRLAGIGKDPDILTVSLQDMLTDQSVPNFETLKANIAQTIAERKEAARAEGAESVLPEPGERRVPLLPKPRHRLKARDLVQRFRSGRKTKASAQTGSQTVLQPKIQVVQAAMERPFDFDMPSAVQDETSLRAPVPSIGKPSRIAPSAPMPKEGEPPVISAELGDVYKKMQRVATMFVSILLLGESGSGKSRLARYIHEWSGRTGKFVSLDCAGLTDDMFYTELFGRAGANVTRPREGAFRKARSGTLFLENVNRLTPTQQSMLVRVLATAGETRLSLPAATPYPACTARVRVIASALPTLMDDVRSGHFRTDLYYRLAGVSSLLPPVREYTYDEREDLLRSFLVALQQKLGQCWNFSGEAWETLIEERWPGNLREVSRILQQICLLSDADSTISREDVLVQLQQSRITDPDDMPEDRENTIQDYHFGLDGYILPRTDVDEGDEDEDEEDYDHDLEDELDELRRLNEKTRFFELGSGENLDDTLSKMRLAKIVEAMDKTNGNILSAAYGVTSKCGTIALHISIGIAQGVMPLIGFSYGAKNYKRVHQVCSLSFKILWVFSIAFLIVVQLMPEADSAMVQLEAANKEAQDTYASMVAEFQSKYEQFNEKQATWTPAVRESKQRELGEIQNRIDEFSQAIQQDMNQLQNTLMAPIYQKAQEVVRNLAQAKGVIYVYDSSSLLYIDETQSINLTQEARKALNIPDDKTIESVMAARQAAAQAQSAQ